MRLFPLLLVPLAVLLSVFLLLPQAAPVVLAQPAGWVEVLGERTRTSKSFMDLSRPGVRLWEGSVGKVHYDGPDWKDIDNTLVPSLANIPTLGLVDMEMVTDDYEFYALQTLNTIPLWFYRNKSVLDTYVTFNPQALQWTNDLDQLSLISMPQSVAGVVTENRLHWEDAYGPGRNLTLSAQAGRLAKALTLEAMPPAPPQFILDGGNPALELRFIFGTPSGPNAPEIWVDGVEWGQSARTETIGAVEFRVAGDVIFSFGRPTAFDSAFGVADASFVLTKQGPNLRVSVRVPLSFLSGAVFPVLIDPTITETIPASGDDGWSCGTPCFDSAHVNTGIGQFAGTVYDTWLRFSSVALPSDDIIDSANLTMVSYMDNDGGSIATNIYMNDIDDAAAPTTQAQHAGMARTAAFTAVDGIDVSIEDTWFTADFASAVDEVTDRAGWSSGNDLMVLWDDDGSGDNFIIQDYTFDSDPAKDAVLTIVHHSETWSNTAPSITNKITAQTTNLDEAYARSFSATDPDTNQTLQWELNTTDAPFTITVTGANRSASVTATPDLVGTYFVNVTVGDDAETGNATDFVNYTLTVREPTAGTLFDSLLPVSLGIAGFFIVVGLYAMGKPGGRTLGQLLVFIGGLALLFAGFDYQLSIGDGQVALMIAVAGLGVVVLSSIEMTRGIGR